MFCKNCGNELKEGTVFCGKCGQKVTGTVVQPVVQPIIQSTVQPEVKPVREKKRKKFPVAVLFICLFLMVAGLGSVIGYRYYNSQEKHISSGVDYSKKSSKKLFNNKDSKKEDKKEDEKEDDEYDKSSIDITKSSSKNMSSKTLYYTYDGKTRAGSYWEFVDKETAKLVFNDGGYYQGSYKFLEGETGMLMTEMYYPQYGLTFDELYSTTAANKKQDDTCIGYVAIVFDNLIEYDASGNVVDDEPANNVLYYGVNYKTDEGILYSVVGGSSAEYYYFIEFEDETL